MSNKRPIVDIPCQRSKRKPLLPSNTLNQENRILVSRKTPFPAQIRRIEKLLQRPDILSIDIHGLGAAITRAVEIALHIQQIHVDAFEHVQVDTHTVELIDDIIPMNHMEHDLMEDVRYNSAIHIRIDKKSPIVHPHPIQPSINPWASSAKIKKIPSATPLTGPTDKVLVCLKKKRK